MQSVQIRYGTGMLHLRAHFPTVIQPSYWTRHRLSRNDVNNIISFIPTKLVWLCALFWGIHIPWFSLRSSAASMLEVTLTGKAAAVDMILEHSDTRLDTIDRLDMTSVESYDHIPPLPLHRIPVKDFEMLKRHLSTELWPESLLVPGEEHGRIHILYDALGIQWTPVRIEGQNICCNAVVKKSEYKRLSYGSLTHEPKMGIYKNIQFCLTDELALFAADRSC